MVVESCEGAGEKREGVVVHGQQGIDDGSGHREDREGVCDDAFIGMMKEG